MRNPKWILMLLIAGILVVTVYAGEIEGHFRGQSFSTAPMEYDWRTDPRLQNHGITEIGFERTKSLTRMQWESYAVNFFSDGRVEYTGIQHVRGLGLHVGRIPVEDFQRLALLIEELGFDDLQLSYRRDVIDSPSVYTSVVRDGERKTIQNYADAGPVQLWAIELAIQDLVKKITWES